MERKNAAAPVPPEVAATVEGMSQPLTSQCTTAALPLLPHHQKMIDDSGITPEIAAARGYRSITTKAELRRLGFAGSQQLVPALLVPVFDATGTEVTYQIRPDEPRRRDGKPIKYETPKGSRPAIDIPPLARQWIGDPFRPLFITEGVRKADAAVSHGLCCVALPGVWSWRGTNEQGGVTALADWEDIALKGRTIYIAFDSDVMTKPQVHEALRRLKVYLEKKAQQVYLIYLPAAAGGGKTGLDDYLAAGHSVDDLLALARPDLLPCPRSDDGEQSPYRADGGRTWRVAQGRDGEIPVPLSNFTAQITAEIYRDVGVGTGERFFEITGTLAGGQPLPVANVAATEFEALSKWVSRAWGARAVIEAGSGTRDHLRAAIQHLSSDVVQRTQYAHTGWRRVDDRWLYLTPGVCIDAGGVVDGIEVVLSEKLARLALPAPPEDEACQAAVAASFELLRLAPLRVTAPLLAVTYLAPLRELLVGEWPDLLVFLVGESQAGKSELAALCQSHYGSFSRTDLALKFIDTENSLERALFDAKDMLAVVDDFYPADNRAEAEKLGRVMSRLLRSTGNGTGRSRMRADLTLRPDYPPRALALATGEHKPEGYSANARAFFVHLTKGMVDLERLSAAQARRHLYAEAMAAYVRWLAGRADELRERLPARVRQLRDEFTSGLRLSRAPGQIAHLYLSLELFADFAVATGALTEAAAQAFLTEAEAALHAEAAEASAEREEETVVDLFCALLRDGLAGRAAYLDIIGFETDRQRWGWEEIETWLGGSPGESQWRHPRGAPLLGWLDRDWVYLYPVPTMQFLQKAARDRGGVFPVREQTLLRRLEEGSLIATTEEKEGTITRRTVKVRRGGGGGVHRVIKLRRSALDLAAALGVDEREQREHREPAGEPESVGPATCSQLPLPEVTGGNSGEGTVNLGRHRVPAVPLVPAASHPGEPNQGSPDDAPLQAQRESLTRLAAYRGYPPLQRVARRSIEGGQEAWERFCATAPLEALEAAGRLLVADTVPADEDTVEAEESTGESP